MADENESRLTDSAIMSESGMHSTLVSTKETKVGASWDDVMNFLRTMSNGIIKKIDKRCDEFIDSQNRMIKEMKE